MTTTTTSAEEELVLQALKLASTQATPLTLSAWPQIALQAVLIVFRGVEMTSAQRAQVVESVLQSLVNSCKLTADEKVELDAVIARFVPNEMFLHLNELFMEGVERRSQTCWTRFTGWWARRCCCGSKSSSPTRS